MKDSPFYREIMDEGAIEQGRKAVQTVLETRFGPDVSKEFSTTINHIGQLHQLDDLLRLASKCRRPSEFRRALQAGSTTA